MVYNFQDRLSHANKRFSEVNQACGIYVRGTIRFPITVSPVLISANEVGPTGDPSQLRVERQDFVVWRCDRGPAGELGLGTHYPPRAGDKIEWGNQTFTLTSMGSDEPPYTHVTSNRERLIVHSVRTQGS